MFQGADLWYNPYPMNLPDELREAFVPRPVDANKYSVGTVAVVGGCDSYPHAPVIAALGARAAGAGLVRLVTPTASRFAAGALVPEATCETLVPDLVPPRADVLVVGMGLGATPATDALVGRLLDGVPGRFVVDADALGALARRGGFAPAVGQRLVLTPHEGEAAKLLARSREEITANRLVAAKDLVARYGATVVLKGPRTLVVSSDGARVYENATGNPVMAMGGMGDLLAGVLGARWAYLKGDPFLAAASSVWLHGAASDALVAAGGDPSVVGTAASLGSLRVRLDLQGKAV